MNRNRMLKRFLEYVCIDTTAREDTAEYPSSAGQIELGKLVVSQLLAIGIGDARQDRYGVVMATVPGNVQGAPTVAFNAHFDTSPETTGKNVRPQVIDHFDGNDVVLPGDSTKFLTSQSCPELRQAKGKTIITTDGTTLLGGDDKAGVAIIMELANHLIENPGIPRGPVRILFTCDEEIGRGVQHVDIQKVAAAACYTFDGGGQDIIDQETFSADLAIVKFTGVNIHPSIAKGKMVNAIRAAGRFLDNLPAELAPERTEGRDGFLHPYHIEGGVAQVALKILLRDFHTPQLNTYADMLKDLAASVVRDCPGVQIDVAISTQYRNMAEGLTREPRAVANAVTAHKRLNRQPSLSIIRGGTDGSRLTELGLPTPNLSSGQHNIHSPLEWACLDEMLAACEVGVEIVKLWAEDGKG